MQLCKTQVIKRNQVCFSSSNTLTDITAIIKDYILKKRFNVCFKISMNWNLTKSHVTRIKSAKNDTPFIQRYLLK